MKNVAFGISFLLIASLGGLFFLGQKSHDGTAAGLVAGLLTECPSSPNCVSSEDNTPEDQRVDPLPVGVWKQLPTAIADLGGTVVRRDDTYVTAEFTSSTFKFVDDVEFRLADNAVHVRSASRVGYSDAGVNSARVAELRAKLGA